MLGVIKAYLLKKSFNADQYVQDSFKYTYQKRRTRLMDILTQHTTGTGSKFVTKDMPKLIQELMGAKWSEVADKPGFRKFITFNVKGEMGLVALKDLPSSASVIYKRQSKGDTGHSSIRAYVEKSVDKQNLDATVLITQSPEQGDATKFGYIISIYPTEASQMDSSIEVKSYKTSPRLNENQQADRKVLTELANFGDAQVTVSVAMSHDVTHAYVL